jgi:DNA-binding NtrC family response regulator
MESTVHTTSVVAIQGGTLSLQSDGRTVDVGSTPCTIGRAAGCDLAVADPRMSSMHCEFVATPTGTRVRDLNSRNGTFVNGLRIRDADLVGDAHIVCGDTTLLFRVAGKDEVMDAAPSFGKLVGRSAIMQRLFARMHRVAKTSLSILILGETGVGKEAFARAIHEESPRRSKPFVVIDCSAIPHALAESKLFGHERGSFTGATERRVSPFVEAHGGTIFLDEIGDLPIDLQPKLLRVLAEKEVQSVGGKGYQHADVRVLAATWRDLRPAVNQQRFRSDLYFRLKEERIEVPPLRERSDDIPLLVEHMLRELGEAAPRSRVSAAAMNRLMRHPWPGNVRELKNVVRSAHSLTDEGMPLALDERLEELRGDDVPPEATALTGSPAGARKLYRDAKREFNREYFTGLWNETGGNVSAMGRAADMTRGAIEPYVQAFNLTKRGKSG